MVPPTSIDGTDITGATIDGTDVQEITVDGQTVFTAGPDLPDSLIHRYDPSAESFSNNDTVNTLTDQIGSADGTTVSGSPTFKTNQINGEPTIQFDDDRIDVSLTSGMDTPLSVSYLVKDDNVGARTHHFTGDTGSNDDPRLATASTGFKIDFGIRFENFGDQSDIDGSYAIITIVNDGTNTTLRVNGTQQFSDDAGSLGFDSGSTHIGQRPGKDGLDGFFGEINFYDEALSGADVTAEENRIATKYGITI